jgi:hypothetical protein
MHHNLVGERSGVTDLPRQVSYGGQRAPHALLPAGHEPLLQAVLTSSGSDHLVTEDP